MPRNGLIPLKVAIEQATERMPLALEQLTAARWVTCPAAMEIFLEQTNVIALFTVSFSHLH